MRMQSLLNPLSLRRQNAESRLWPAEMRRIHDEVDRVFGDLFANTQLPLTNGDGTEAFFADMDVCESDDAVEVALDVPGLKREEIEIDLAGDRLTVSGKREWKEEKKDRNYYRAERGHGEFSRSVRLPDEVDPAKIKADLKDGVLRIHLPKAPQAKQTRKKIEIHTS
ncbi:Hsp20/alpha crystallin family protein [Maricaulis sp.]|uniref:Hsp20/alpha crystallin family protein n=1 Tax=Maricaulis sp. TaxID=1486257 RepID=UPI001B14299C|nr:Hsp20/alpha crystallin family protein [Maricaulis sp.]MBO6763844.1 Hsp20/alpha crystallin family protein [Maricaulis sp.]